MAAEDSEKACCWICLEDSEADMFKPCVCPRPVHKRCLARWQIQQSGKQEEKICRFCSRKLPPWIKTITPADVKPAKEAVVTVNAPDGTRHAIAVKPGLAGRRDFTRKVRQLVHIPEEHEISFNFNINIKVPGYEDMQSLATDDFLVVSQLAALNAGFKQRQMELRAAETAAANDTQQPQQQQQQPPQPPLSPSRQSLNSNQGNANTNSSNTAADSRRVTRASRRAECANVPEQPPARRRRTSRHV